MGRWRRSMPRKFFRQKFLLAGILFGQWRSVLGRLMQPNLCLKRLLNACRMTPLEKHAYEAKLTDRSLDILMASPVSSSVVKVVIRLTLYCGTVSSTIDSCQEILYCSNANPVKIAPSATRRGIISCFIVESRRATHSILNAEQKHFATLSKYLSMKDTKRPHIPSDITVAYA